MFALVTKSLFCPACAVLLLVAAPRLAIADTNQANAQATAANTNHKGSDDDVDEAVSNGMKALMNLAVLNIPGAFSKGYEAYGNYINSTKLDDLEAKTKNLTGTMASAGQGALAAAGKSGTAKAATDSGVSGTVFTKRLRPEVLKSGSASVLAAEFEKRSGMSREELMQHFNSTVDAQLNYQDPELLNKLEQRFHAFKARVPNKEFREGLDSAENLFSSPQKTKILGEIMAFYQSAVTGGKPEANLASANTASSAKAEANNATLKVETVAPKVGDPKLADVSAMAKAENEAEIGASAENGNRAPASMEPPVAGPAEKLGMFIGLNGNSDALKDLFQAENMNGEEATLFKLVSIRYRKLTPSLVSTLRK